MPACGCFEIAHRQHGAIRLPVGSVRMAFIKDLFPATIENSICNQQVVYLFY